MRKSIRLTGRKQLPQSAFTVSIGSAAPLQTVKLEVADSWESSTFPKESEIRVKLVEDKFVEVVHLGTVGAPLRSAPLSSSVFRAPSCQVRIVSRDIKSDGLLLGSTKPWTLRSEGNPEGILLFQPADIKPRLWKLQIRQQEHPILYIDERVPNAAHWAKTDPIFAACVLPQIVAEVLRVVLENPDASDDTWEADWTKWAQSLAPGEPPFDGDDLEQNVWVDDLVDAFSMKHDLLATALLRLEGPT